MLHELHPILPTSTERDKNSTQKNTSNTVSTQLGYDMGYKSVLKHAGYLILGSRGRP